MFPLALTPQSAVRAPRLVPLALTLFLPNVCLPNHCSQIFLTRRDKMPSERVMRRTPSKLFEEPETVGWEIGTGDLEVRS